MNTEIHIPVDSLAHFESKFKDADRFYLIEFTRTATEEAIESVLRTAEGTTSTYDAEKRCLKVYHPANQWSALNHEAKALVIELGSAMI